MRFTLLFLMACSIFSAAHVGVIAAEQPRPVRAEILADVSAVTPGVPFEAAVLLKVDPHWHVYWKNPGDSGLPTSVEFTLPPGFTASEIKWPIPSMFMGAGGLTDYGYEDSLLLSAGIVPPADLKPSTAVKITAVVSWVSCRDICIPGKAELELEMSVSESARRVNTDLVSEWSARLPVNYSGNTPPFEIDIKTVPKDENEYSVVILLGPKDSSSGIGLYPVPGNSFIVDDIVAGTDEGSGRSSAAFDVKVLPSRGQPQKGLEALIVYTDKDGKRSGYELEV
ncbi:MAG TPA: protein-disulfide reductase DsbD domain-containing protein, partial [Thermodesulfobacteriota bacterium]|nr:protein-disulfide reductase DsbD domain-containing protein [Thermodesulfobacteriota bacterium]